jgi:hypothetical protein
MLILVGNFLIKTKVCIIVIYVELTRLACIFLLISLYIYIYIYCMTNFVRTRKKQNNI